MTTEARKTRGESISRAVWRSFIFAKVSMNKLVIGHWMLVCTLGFVVSCAPSHTGADEPAVRAHLERYFSTWSAQDMDGYGACFHPQARITFVTPQGVSAQGLTDFLHGQRLTHQAAADPMKEVPLDMQFQVGKGIVTAAVKWELQKQDGNKTGTDFFTLAKTPEGWRIVALVWEQD